MTSGAFRTDSYPALGGVFRSRPLAIIATVAAIGLLWAGKVLFVTFFFALFLSFAILPFVELLERIRIPRVIAILIVLLLLFALFVFFIGNALQQAEAFSREWPSYGTRIRTFATKAQGLFSKFEEQTKNLLPEVDRSVRAVKLEERAIDSLSRVVLQLRTLVSLLIYVSAVPMLSFFMLKDREKFAKGITRILRKRGGVAASEFAEGMARVLSGYLVGELFVVLITACVMTAGLLVLQVPYSYVLGPLGGLCVLLPYVGVILATTPALLVALLSGADASLAVKVIIFYSAVQFLEGNVLTPFLVGGRVRLHPLALLIALIFWGSLWGIPGAILAVPLTATLKVFAERSDRFSAWASLLGDPTPGFGAEEAQGASTG